MHNNKDVKRRTLLAAGLSAALPMATASAQAWPAKTVTLVVPFAPGGGTDTFARPFAAKLAQQIGQQVIIDNRAGAGGTVGAAVVARAQPDGYTFLVGAVHHTVAVSAYKKLSYDLDKDLIPVTGMAYVPDVLVVNPKVPAKTLPEFIAYCKANPGKVDYGSSGLGTTRHLAGEIFNARTGAQMVHVPYKGSGPATAALINGEVSAVFEGLGSAAGHIRSGTVRAGSVRPYALASVSRYSHCCRRRCARLRVAVLVRIVGAGGNATRGRGEAPERNGQGVRGTRHQEHLVPAGR